MKHNIQITSEFKDRILYFEFINQSKNKVDSSKDNELKFVDTYLAQLLGEFEIPGKQVALTGDYQTLKLVLAQIIKHYNSYNIDAFIPPYI